MAKDPTFVLDYLKQIEVLADDVLSDRRDIIELNKKRDKTREASRSLKNSSLHRHEKDLWMCCGNVFINFNKKETFKILEKGFFYFHF
jgi:hypothetical protein